MLPKSKLAVHTAWLLWCMLYGKVHPRGKSRTIWQTESQGKPQWPPALHQVPLFQPCVGLRRPRHQTQSIFSDCCWKQWQVKAGDPQQTNSGKQKKQEEARISFVHHCSERAKNFPTAKSKVASRSPIYIISRQCFTFMVRGGGGFAGTWFTRIVNTLVCFGKGYMQNLDSPK